MSNLRGMLLMSAAAVLAVAISFSLFAGALVLHEREETSRVHQWGDPGFAIFMHADATPSQIDAVRAQLRATPHVKRFDFVGKEKAYQEARTTFAKNPDVLATLSVERMPPSYRVVTTRREFMHSVGDRFTDEPGVRKVTYPAALGPTESPSDRVLQLRLVIGALISLVVAALLGIGMLRVAWKRR